MFAKLKLGSSIAALLLFALPWIDIQCSEKSMGTQSGLQVIYGGASPSEELKAMNNDAKTNQASKSDESMGFAPLVALALVVIIAAVVFSGIAFTRADARAETLSSMLPTAAFVLLLIQLAVGFPAKKKVIELMSKGSSSGTASAGSAEMEKSMTAAIMMNFRVRTTTAFYLELLALGIPTLVLANGLLDKYKKGQQPGVGGPQNRISGL